MYADILVCTVMGTAPLATPRAWRCTPSTAAHVARDIARVSVQRAAEFLRALGFPLSLALAVLAGRTLDMMI